MIDIKGIIDKVSKKVGFFNKKLSSLICLFFGFLHHDFHEMPKEVLSDLLDLIGERDASLATFIGGDEQKKIKIA